MSNVSLDLNKLLGFKVTLRALAAMRGEACRPADEHGSEGGTSGTHSAVLRSRIGIKGLPGLRYRRAG